MPLSCGLGPYIDTLCTTLYPFGSLDARFRRGKSEVRERSYSLTSLLGFGQISPAHETPQAKIS
jgi:hypothetical protein